MLSHRFKDDGTPLTHSAERVAYSHMHICIGSSHVRIHGHTAKLFGKKFSNKLVFSSSYIMQSLQLPYKMQCISLENVHRQKFSISLNPFPCFSAIPDFNLCTWDAFIKFSDTSTSDAFQLQLSTRDYSPFSNSLKQSSHFCILQRIFLLLFRSNPAQEDAV